MGSVLDKYLDFHFNIDVKKPFDLIISGLNKPN